MAAEASNRIGSLKDRGKQGGKAKSQAEKVAQGCLFMTFRTCRYKKWKI